MATDLELARQPEVTPMQILNNAISTGASIEQLTQLLALQERWEANEARKAFNLSMATFKANPPRISKNKHVKFGNTEYSHATLDHVTEQITQALSKVGISHKWAVKQEGAAISVTCILTHQQGHSEATTLTAAADSSGSKNAIQAIGSAVTYLQRYTLLAATGMAAGGIDDDGQAASAIPRMAEPDFLQRMDWIRGANNLAELQRIFIDAVKDAKRLGDKEAEQMFTKAKDAKKMEMR